MDDDQNTRTEPPENPLALLASLEMDIDAARWPHRRSGAYRRLAEAYRASGDEPRGQRAEWHAMLFDLRTVRRGDERRTEGGGRFAPMVTFDGGSVYPEPA